MLAALLALQQVLVVDADGPSFNDIQTAVDLAEPGSLILVHPGVYEPFVVDSKSVSIVALGPERPLLSSEGVSSCPGETRGPVTIQGLDADQSVVLRGFDLQGIHDELLLGGDGCIGSQSEKVSEPGVDVLDCIGTVVLEDLEPSVVSWLRVQDSQAVVTSRSEWRGGDRDFITPPSLGGDEISATVGLRATRSTVLVFESGIRGGDGNVTFTPFGTPQFLAGAAGVSAVQAELSLQTSTQLSGTAKAALETFFDTNVYSGSSTFNQNNPLSPSTALSPETLLVERSVPLVTLDAPAVSNAGQPTALALTGPADAAAFLLFTFDPDGALFPELVTGLATGFAPAILPLGVYPPTGELQLPINVPPLPPGVPFFRWVLQPAAASLDAGVVLGSPSVSFAYAP